MGRVNYVDIARIVSSDLVDLSTVRRELTFVTKASAPGESDKELRLWSEERDLLVLPRNYKVPWRFPFPPLTVVLPRVHYWQSEREYHSKDPPAKPIPGGCRGFPKIRCHRLPRVR
jgi:hypothetical protein